MGDGQALRHPFRTRSESCQHAGLVLNLSSTSSASRSSRYRRRVDSLTRHLAAMVSAACAELCSRLSILRRRIG